MEIKKSFFLDSARTGLKSWNRVDRGPFTIQGQKGKEIGREVPKLSTISWCGICAEPCKKQPLFLKALPWRSSPEPCMPKHAFLDANFRSKSVTIHVFGTKRAIDASYRALDGSGCLPAQQKTLLSVGCGQRTRATRHIGGALCRTICLISAFD